jgi:glycosyltransferase involved in cell wall biosynthesis
MAGARPLAYKRAMASAGGTRGKLIFLVTEDWYFWSHRLPMARAARDAGFAVAVATRVAAHGERIRAEGFALHPLRWRRARRGIGASLAAVIEISRLYRREQPLVVHHVALKAALLGAVAARIARVPAVVSMIAGAGYLASSTRRGPRLVARLLGRLWPVLLLRRGNRVIVQNDADCAALAARRPDAAWRIAIIPGSGVDLAHFRPVPEPPSPPLVVAYAGRMIAIKGVAELVAAHALLRRRGLAIRLVLAGAPDPENPSAIDPATLAHWAALPDVAWLGHQDDVRALWREAHVAVLASHGGEGVPKSLLEAAAMGRPIVATDIPGTRSIARNGVNAVLVPPGDVAALADAIAALAADPERRRRYGAASRAIVAEGFTDEAIGAATAALYDALLDEVGAGSGPGKKLSIRPSNR